MIIELLRCYVKPWMSVVISKITVTLEEVISSDEEDDLDLEVISLGHGVILVDNDTTNGSEL